MDQFTNSRQIAQRDREPCLAKKHSRTPDSYISTPPTMKDIYKDEELELPKNVTCEIKARIITVTGPRGVLRKNVRHIDMELRKVGNKIKFIVWHGSRKHVACLRTVRTLINNMIIGVTKGFRYKMRLVYAHFPINCNIDNDGGIEIRNFLGEKVVRKIQPLDGAKIAISQAQKDELIVEGISLENVSQTAASIQQICNVRNKDIRKFLDGIYVSARETIEQD
ncbi:60S ribosomal protein L9-A [Neolecta irregularis DAH-3]|uniref:60S ribosomal protein L9-A n=1 Tax=Neolecta irregularis (strain DAH-3) TaxID=1198029 RepID=A0A1U7LSD8_NEOID|nr:60S ribosomal protein L9-A [Neolecta irregularis DAH-3]|eukprot:OLL25564.1 60S ribosomal protein L9-A [Neolecta irregularis DAH-3]